MASRPAFELDTKTIGALPLVNHFLGRLRLEHFLRKHLSPPDPRSKLPPLSALGVIVRNLVLARMPIYSVQKWVKDRVPALLEFAKLAAPATYQRTASIHRARRRIAVRPPPAPRRARAPRQSECLDTRQGHIATGSGTQRPHYPGGTGICRRAHSGGEGLRRADESARLAGGESVARVRRAGLHLHLKQQIVCLA